MTIRPARDAESAAVRELVQRAYGHYIARIGRRPMPMDADYAAQVSAGRVFVAAAGDEIAGILVLVPHDDHLLVENVAVDPTRQGEGVGRALLAFAEREAAAAGLPELRLYTHVKMTENRALYARLGYREVECRAEDNFERVFMSKPTPA